MSKELVSFEEDKDALVEIGALDVSIFEEPMKKPAVAMERSLDIARMVCVTLFLDEDGGIVDRHELDYYEIAYESVRGGVIASQYNITD